MFGWITIGANGLAGVVALVAWRVGAVRGPFVWLLTVAAQVILAVEVTIGVVLEGDEDIMAPRFHTFYGFVGLITVGLAYSYRASMRGRLEMFYGLVGLFLMGIAIRAFTLT